MTTRALRVTRPRDHRHPPSPFLSQIATYNANGNCGTGGVESTSSDLGIKTKVLCSESKTSTAVSVGVWVYHAWVTV